ncbi:EAL domain-containing protein [Pseudomonas aeruginosa]|nr:EAL domain-containing protein [Pseudomonas aeruginosa]
MSESVGDPACASALANMIGLAEQLGMEVVAEGVEDRQQLSLMRELECDFVQGFLIAPALPAEVFLQMLREKAGSF